MDANLEASPADDLSALAWVHGELRKSLEIAHKSLRRYLKEAEGLSGSDVAAVDAALLRAARVQLHQGVGALEMIRLPAPAQVLRACEAAVQRMVSRPSLVDAAAVDAIEKTSFALLDYLSRLLAGKSVSPVALFPQYRAVQKLAGADRVHPADLWLNDWRWQELPTDTAAPPRVADDDARGAMEWQVLALMRSPDRPALARMSDLCAELGVGSGAPRLATLWQLAAAFFEAQALGLLAVDLYTKRMASRLLAQLRTTVKGQDDLSDRLAQDLLFFCGHAQAPAEGVAPRLTAVRRAWALNASAAADYETPRLGRFDPAWIAQAKKRVAGAKDSWSAVAGGELHRYTGLAEQFALVGESLRRLFPSGEVLAAALQGAVAQMVADGAAPPAPLAMEIATAMLYLDASLEDGELDQPALGERVQRLARRIDEVRQGADPQPLEAWMEELYRRVSDRQTMGSVVQELRASLSEVEKQIDQYFRDPSQRELLIPVPSQLSAMRGVLSVLGMEQASQAVLRMRDDIDELAQTEVDPQRAAQAGTFDRLADNLGALSFLIDMLSVQPRLAKSLFRFDPATGNLSAVMGHVERPSVFAALDDAAVPVAPPPLLDQAQSLAQAAAQPEVPDDLLSQELERLAQQAAAAEQPALARAMSSAGHALRGAVDDDTRQAVRAELAQTMADFVPLSPAPLAEPVSAPVPVASDKPVAEGDTGLEDDAEMREIFIEEAREVIANARASVQKLIDEPEDAGEMTALRRAFHTLKGSGRMVGLRDFGEAAWAFEQLFNARLAQSPRLDHPLRHLTEEALAYLEGWTEAIAASRREGHASPALVRAADAMRLDGQRLPIVAPGVTAAEPPPALDESLPDAAAAAAAETETEAERELEPLPEITFELEPALETLAARVPDLPSAADLDLAGPAAQAPAVEAATAEAFSFEFDLGDFDAPAPSAPLQPAAADDLAFEPLPPAVASVEPEGEREPEPEPAAPPTAEAVELDLADFDFDFGDAAMPGELPPPDVTGAPAEPAAAASPEPESASDSELAALFEEFGQSDLAAEPEAKPEPEPEPHAEPATELLAEAVHEPEPEPAAELVSEASTEPAVVEPEPEGQSEPAEAAEPAEASEEPEPAEAPVEPEASEPAAIAEDEQVKVIGDLRIGIPLFNIFLNEADEQSRRLGTELAEWALEHERHPVTENAAALAHSLAGNSATVGYADLSALARALEHALMRSHAAGPGRAGEPELFNDAADEIRRLLHQFAAGFLRPVDAALMTRLADHERWPAPPAPAFAPASAAVPLHQAVFDDEIDVEDALDADLFPIFEEEADELLPQLQARLREWVDHPADPEAPAACMRTLHTFKGGARLAGAMRLGEMAHRLETAIEYLAAQGAVPANEVEPLLAHADGMSHAFDALRKPAARDTEPVAAAPAPATEPALAAELAAAEPVPELVPSEPAEAPAAAAAEPAAAEVVPRAAAAAVAIDWSRFTPGDSAVVAAAERTAPASSAVVRVRGTLLDRMVNQAGEVSITRARLDADVKVLQNALNELTDSLDRMRRQLRDIELQAETQMSSRMEAAKVASAAFDPLEMDRFTRFQELTRFMAESVNDVATLQRSLQRTLQSTEDELAAQARLTRELQDDLLRTRMVEFESLADRLYRTVRQAAKDTARQVRLDIVGGAIEVDRSVLERMAGPFEHLLRNCVAHGIEPPAQREAAGKGAAGSITISIAQEGNEVGVEVRDDGAGLNLTRIRERGVERGLIAADAELSDAELAELIFSPGFSTAQSVTELAGRGVGLDVVRAEVNAMGGRIQTESTPGQGTAFRLLLPLTTAVTQVVMLRCGELNVAVPSTLVEVVRRARAEEVEAAYASGSYTFGDEVLPFHWLAALLQGSARGGTEGRTQPLVIIRSAAQRVALHVDEIVGNQEVVVKNVGPQLAHMPGLAGVTLLPSGAVALIYNPVALATLYGPAAHARLAQGAGATPLEPVAAVVETKAPLVLVVDDSLTVRRVTQRLLLREGYRVTTAKDGLDALERLVEERPTVMLSDIEMPRMDGFDLVRNVRADPRFADLPVIMITSRIAEKHREYAAALGVDHYLGKPYSEEELLSLVARHAGADIPT